MFNDFEILALELLRYISVQVCTYMSHHMAMTDIVGKQLCNFTSVLISFMDQFLYVCRLSFNIDKINCMISKLNEICLTIHIKGFSIQEMDSAKFIAKIIDNKLNWLEHVKCISRKIGRSNGIIVQARKSFETLLNLYDPLIILPISYRIHVRFATTAAVRMMTSSNGNILRVTGPLCGEFTGHR